jgi:N-acetylglutamate synthase-like GNAT family acetyltransferase
MDDFKSYYALRYRVLREPLGQPKGTEKDDFEPLSHHYMAVDDQTGELAGVVKLFEREPGVGQFSHIAVSEKYQHHGIGRLLVETVEAKAREMRYRKMGTLTRVTATGFYERCGYIPQGFAEMLFGKLKMIWLEKDLK